MSPPWFTDSSSDRRTPSSHLPLHIRNEPNHTILPPLQNRHRRPRGGIYHPKPTETLDVAHKLQSLVLNSHDSPMKENVGEATVEASGLDIPPPAMSFSEMAFSTKDLVDNIARCKYVTPTPIQKYAIPVAIAGRDLMACAQTGSGKTAAFCFPIINGIAVDKQKNKRLSGYGNARFLACPSALILAPTRELACQIQEEAKKFSHQTGIKVVVVYGGAPIFQQLRNLERGVDILVATPGRLVDMVGRGRVSLGNVKYLVLDEADRMLDMGFEPQVREIVQRMEMPPPGERQTMLFSATFPDKIQRLASDFLLNHIFLAAGEVGSSTDLIVQRVEFVTARKQDHLVNLLRAQHTKKALTLVFVETKKGADALERWLCRKGFPSAAIHGDKVQMEREWALKSFRRGDTPILVATDVAARGLDIPHVAHVINFDLPRCIDDYVHRIGRTGRAGKSGLATAFFTSDNAPLAKALVQLMLRANQQIPAWLTEYANNDDDAYAHAHVGRHTYGEPSTYSPPSPRATYSFPADSYSSVTATGWD